MKDTAFMSELTVNDTEWTSFRHVINTLLNNNNNNNGSYETIVNTMFEKLGMRCNMSLTFIFYTLVLVIYKKTWWK